MVQVLEKNHFKEMPWKNGGGTTTELFCIGTENEIILRISVAEVRQDGPFSLFPELKRILYLLSGRNMCLNFTDKTHTLKEPFDYCEFNGNESINCLIKSGPCRDFNLMLNPNHWSMISHKSSAIKAHSHYPVRSSSHYLFVFLLNEFKLIHLEPDQTYVLKPVLDERIIEVTLAKI